MFFVGISESGERSAKREGSRGKCLFRRSGKSLLTHLRASFAETSPALSSGLPDFQSWTAGKIDQKKEIRKSAAPGAAEGAAVGDLGQAKWKAEAQSGRPRGGSGAESRAQAQATSKDESWASRGGGRVHDCK